METRGHTLEIVERTRTSACPPDWLVLLAWFRPRAAGRADGPPQPARPARGTDRRPCLGVGGSATASLPTVTRSKSAAP